MRPCSCVLQSRSCVLRVMAKAELSPSALIQKCIDPDVQPRIVGFCWWSNTDLACYSRLGRIAKFFGERCEIRIGIAAGIGVSTPAQGNPSENNEARQKRIRPAAIPVPTQGSTRPAPFGSCPFVECSPGAFTLTGTVYCLPINARTNSRGLPASLTGARQPA